MKYQQIHYVYITTNLINGKQYVGDHSKYKYKEKNYLGSGVYITKAIKEYGKLNFTNKILEYFNSRREASLSQEKYIRLYQTHVSQGGYNISWTGGTNCNGKHSKESIELMKKNHKPTKGIKRKLSEKEKQKIKEKINLLEKNKSEYLEHPNKCKCCGTNLKYRDIPLIFCSVSCSTKYVQSIKHQICLDKYLLNPKRCKCCKNVINFDKRFNAYCSSECKTKSLFQKRITDKEFTKNKWNKLRLDHYKFMEEEKNKKLKEEEQKRLDHFLQKTMVSTYQ